MFELIAVTQCYDSWLFAMIRSHDRVVDGKTERHWTGHNLQVDQARDGTIIVYASDEKVDPDPQQESPAFVAEWLTGLGGDFRIVLDPKPAEEWLPRRRRRRSA